MTYLNAAEVRDWANLELATDEALGVVIAAVEAKLPLRYVDYTVAGSEPAELAPDVKVAMLMQCARIWRRRKTPDGVAAFGDEVVIRVNRFDPDIDDMLADYRKAPLAVV